MKKPTYKGKELLPLSVIDAARDGQHHKLKEKMERNLFAGSFHCVKI